MEAGMLLGDIANRGALLFGERDAFVWPGRKRTYVSLDDRVARAATVLRNAGVTEGTRLAVLSPNTPEVIEFVLAASLLGGVTVPLNARLAPDEIRYQIDDADVEHALVHPALEALASSSGLLDRRTWSVGREFDDELEGAAPQALDQHDRPTSDSPCIQLYTSGTTGVPKGCLLSHRAWIASCANMAHEMAISGSDRLLGIYPFFHVAGFGLALTHLLMGATIVLNQAVDPDEIWGLVNDEHLTLIGLPGLRAMLSHPACAAADRSSLRGIIGGANMESTETLDLLDDMVPGVRFFGVYGSTEAGNFVSLSSASAERERPGTIGRPLIGFNVAILSDAGWPLPVGEVGELGLRGPSTMLGYSKLPDASETALRNGWLHTGDLMRLDTDGYLYFVDRVKDLIKSGGENVYSIEVENVLSTHPAVADVAVVGVPDRKWGEAVKALIVLAPCTSVTADQLDEHCLERLGAFKRPRWYEFVEAVPRSTLGKILKKEIRAAHDPNQAERLEERS